MNKGSEFIRLMGKHVVVLTGIRIDRRERKKRQFAYSGFVIKIREEWFWVTAGHCLKQLRRWIRKTRFHLSSICFADFFGPKAKSLDLIPFDIKTAELFSLDQMEVGLDFGMVHLDETYRIEFEANGVTPITRMHWIEPSKFEFETFKMLGFPKHLTTDGAIQPVLLTVEQVDPIEYDQPNSWFAGLISVGKDQISDLDGMSGGPIFGFTKQQDGSWGYQAIAIQSCWDARKRVAFGCRLSLFAEAARNEIVSSGG